MALNVLGLIEQLLTVLLGNFVLLYTVLGSIKVVLKHHENSYYKSRLF